MFMKLVKEFETNQCRVYVYDTGFAVDYDHIYCIRSYHKNNDKVLTRFGTRQQVESIVATYRIEKEFEL